MTATQTTAGRAEEKSSDRKQPGEGPGHGSRVGSPMGRQGREARDEVVVSGDADGSASGVLTGAVVTGAVAGAVTGVFAGGAFAGGAVAGGALTAAGGEALPSRGPGQPTWRRHLVGNSRAMQPVYDMIRLLAPRQSTVLIQGETGTGKEKVARALHEASGRKGSLVSLNCTALPETLLESELFGHVKGAFTGATQVRKGRFEEAHLGTIFLDEVGDMPLETQAKLLRVLQEREVQRLGSSETIAIDVRVIAATNVNLLESVERGRFRSDLYYRLNVVPIALPALRERAEDIPELVKHFITRGCQREGVPPKWISDETLTQLREFAWPGNVRELENAVERALTLSGERNCIVLDDFRLSMEGARPVGAYRWPAPQTMGAQPNSPSGIAYGAAGPASVGGRIPSSHGEGPGLEANLDGQNGPEGAAAAEGVSSEEGGLARGQGRASGPPAQQPLFPEQLLPPNWGSVMQERGIDFEATIEQLSRRLIDLALRQSNGNKKKAAERLGLKRTTLTAKLRSMSAAS